MQSYLSIIDPLLFPMLKAIRRTFQLQPSLKWAIDGEIAVALYAHQAGLALVNIGTPDLHIDVEANTVEEVSRLESVLAELVRQGFSREDMCLCYPLALPRVQIKLVNRVSPNWVCNAKGKTTYPLYPIGHIIEETTGEKVAWVRDVANHVIIE